jgi:MFS family permease
MTGVEERGAVDGAEAGGTAQPRLSLLRGPFLLILPLTLFGYGLETVVRTVAPLMMLARGGDAVAVGILASAYALPSVIFRPIVGGLIDSWRHGRLLRSGMVATTIVPMFLLLPGQLTLIVIRFINGIAWTFFSVSTHSLVAKLAPPDRRGEASGIFMGMYAVASLLGPGIAVALYAGSGEALALLVAALLGVIAFVVTTRIKVPESGPGATAQDVPTTTAARWLGRLVEPSALPWTLLLITSYSAYAIFSIFPPVYALEVGVPVEVLVAYFPIFGFAQAISSPLFGRLGDRVGRRTSMVIGCTVAGVGLLIATIPSFITFTIAAFVFSMSQSLVNSTISALTMERAPKHRLGSAMATYTMGFQIATGLSSLLWGALITSVGFGAVFLVGAAFQVLSVVLSFVLIGTPPRRDPAPR